MENTQGRINEDICNPPEEKIQKILRDIEQFNLVTFMCILWHVVLKLKQYENY